MHPILPSWVTRTKTRSAKDWTRTSVWTLLMRRARWAVGMSEEGAGAAVGGSPGVLARSRFARSRRELIARGTR